MKPLPCLLLAALPLAAAAQTPTADSTTYRHQLGLTASPVLEGFFRNNRSLPLGLLYKRQLKPNSALRLGMVLNQRYDQRYNTQLRVNPTFTSKSLGLELYVGHEWQRLLTPRLIAYTGLDFGVRYDRFSYQEEKIQIASFNGLDEMLVFESTELARDYSVFLRPLLGIRYQLKSYLYVSAEATLSLRFLQKNYKAHNSLTRDATGEIASATTTIKDRTVQTSLRPISQLTLHYCFVSINR